MTLKNKILSFSVFVIMIFLTHFFTLNLLKTTNYGNWGNWNEIIKGVRSDDYIFLGSSRTTQHINNNYIKNNFGLESYNLGIDGGMFDLHLEKLKIYLKYNSKPINIVIGLDSEAFQTKKGIHNIHQFVHMGNQESLLNTIQSYDSKFSLVKYIPLYGLTYFDPLQTLAFIKHSVIPNDNNVYKNGFNPVYANFNEEFEQFKIINPNGINFKVDNNLIKKLESIIKLSLKNEMKVFLVFSPSYSEVQNYINNRTEIINIYESLSQKYNIPFLDFSDSYISQDKKYFYNSQHLNYTGATEFTRILMTQLTNKKR
jgi:hypothetical protein